MKKEKLIYSVSTIYWYFIIFGFSAESATISGEKSARVAAFLEKLFSKLSFGVFSYDKQVFVFELSHILRKCAHALIFAIMAVLLCLLLRAFCKKLFCGTAFFTTVALAACDELHQLFVPGRGPALRDVAIDALGALVAVIVLSEFLRVQEIPRGKLLQKGKKNGKRDIKST